MARRPACVLSSVTSFSFHTIEARGLKIGMDHPYIDGSKVTVQIFIFCPEVPTFVTQKQYYFVNWG